MSTARLFPCMFQHIACDIAFCYSPATWFVGLPDGPESAHYKLCESCAKAMIANAPDELVPEETKALIWQESTEIPVKRRAKKAAAAEIDK